MSGLEFSLILQSRSSSIHPSPCNHDEAARDGQSMGSALEWRIEGMERGIPCLGEVDGDVADVGGEADDSESD